MNCPPRGPRPVAGLADGSPATLRAELEQSLQLLRVETIDLYQLHTVDSRVPVSESVGALAQMHAASGTGGPMLWGPSCTMVSNRGSRRISGPAAV